jgi:hypothetical protein
MFLGGAVFGIVAISVAMWRSPVVPRIAALLMLAFGVLDFAIGSPVISHIVGLAAVTVVAAAILIKYSRPARKDAE